MNIGRGGLAWLSFFLFLATPGGAQPQTLFISFKDKTGSPFSVSRPEEFLSTRSVERRIKNNVSITEEDLPVNPDYLNALNGLGATIMHTSRWLNGAFISLPDSNLITQILQLSFVSDGKMMRKPALGKRFSLLESKFGKTRSEMFGQTAETNSLYGLGENQISMLGGTFLHQIGLRGKGVLIAVLDAGFSNANSIKPLDSLRVRNGIVASRDFVNPGGDVYGEHSHGTNVLSTMASNLPGSFVGTAPDADYLLLRTENGFSETIAEEYHWVAAAEFADSMGADLITSSLGYSVMDDPAQSHTYGDLNGEITPITKGAEMAFSKGMLVLNSAGNEGSSSWQFIIAPADGKNVIAVGAVDSVKLRATFSSKGPSSDGRIKPDIATRGYLATVASTTGGIMQGNGTSFSCPIAAGMAACLIQGNPERSVVELRQYILSSSSQYDLPDNLLGYGIPDFSKAHLLMRGTSGDQPADERLIYLSPNPVHNFITFGFYSTSNQDVEVCIFDLLGRKIFSEAGSFEKEHYHTKVIHLEESFKAGIYFLMVQGEAGNYMVKFLKL